MPTTIASSADMAVDGEEDRSNVAELESFAIAQFGVQDTNCFFTADNLCLGCCLVAKMVTGLACRSLLRGSEQCSTSYWDLYTGPGATNLDERVQDVGIEEHTSEASVLP